MQPAYPLVVIYGRLARYDKWNGGVPFSGSAGEMFKHRTIDLLSPNTPIEVRLMGTPDMARPYPLNARLLLLGEDALIVANVDPNLNKHRGYGLTATSPLTGTKHAAVATYHPIDCWDFTNLESNDEDDDTNDDAKDVAATKRANYFAWALHDFWKLIARATPNWSYDELPMMPVQSLDHDRIATWINNLPVGAAVTLDIECRGADHSLDVIGLRADGLTYIIPWYTHTNRLAFTGTRTLGRIWRALANLFLRDDVTIVGHNLAFDLSVLCVTLGLPLPTRLYDTMIAMHRAEPLLEKSLSHAISYYLVTPRNHKADICPNVSAQNFERLCRYNAEDLVRTDQLRFAQLNRMTTRPDVQLAVKQGNALLHTTLMMSLTGIATDQAMSRQVQQDYLLKAEQLRRCCCILTGNPSFNPGSPDQTANYFYNMLHYPIAEFTDTGAPATGAKALYGLQLAQDNPLIPLIIEYREARKAASSLEFRKFKLPALPTITPVT